MKVKKYFTAKETLETCRRYAGRSDIGIGWVYERFHRHCPAHLKGTKVVIPLSIHQLIVMEASVYKKKNADRNPAQNRRVCVDESGPALANLAKIDRQATKKLQDEIKRLELDLKKESKSRSKLENQIDSLRDALQKMQQKPAGYISEKSVISEDSLWCSRKINECANDLHEPYSHIRQECYDLFLRSVTPEDLDPKCDPAYWNIGQPGYPKTKIEYIEDYLGLMPEFRAALPGIIEYIKKKRTNGQQELGL